MFLKKKRMHREIFPSLEEILRHKVQVKINHSNIFKENTSSSNCPYYREHNICSFLQFVYS